MIGASWLDVVDSPEERDRWTALLSAETASEAPAQHFQGVTHLRNASPRFIESDATVLRDEDGEPAGLAAIGRDLTDHKALEKRVAQAERLESIGRLAAGVVHDFNSRPRDLFMPMVLKCAAF